MYRLFAGIGGGRRQAVGAEIIVDPATKGGDVAEDGRHVVRTDAAAAMMLTPRASAAAALLVIERVTKLSRYLLTIALMWSNASAGARPETLAARRGKE